MSQASLVESLRNESFDSALAVQMLINAEAHLLAEHGSRHLIKDTPEKQAAQFISFARDRVVNRLMRERAATFSSKSVEQLEEESKAAAIEAVEEMQKQPDKDVTYAERKGKN